MNFKRIILLYMAIIFTVIALFPSVSFSYSPTNEIIAQYIMELSRDIHSSIKEPGKGILSGSDGEVRLKLHLSPWGDLKDAYISKSSGSEKLDSICLKGVWIYKKYQPFPEELGDIDLWMDIPIIFRVPESKKVELKTTSKVFEPQINVLDLEINDELFSIDGDISKINVSGMEDAMDIAFQNSMTRQIAQEEIELSRLKIREARRALYPTASLNYMETIGTTTGTTQDFTDKEYKVKFEYPLYYGWRLKYAVNQAVSNMKASRNSYDKLLHEIRGEVETAFYTYLVNAVNLKLQYNLFKELKEIFSIAKKRFDKGLTTRAEFLQVESQMKQVAYQLRSSENDLSLAELTLAQAMNVEDTKDLKKLVNMDTSLMDLKPIDIGVTLEDCMELAIRKRPDLREKEYMVEFNEYGKKIEESKSQFKVDLTGSYGKSGGAFESETLELTNDWFMGFKVSRPLGGGNTLSSSYTKEETSEKHGQSTRTESISKSMELGILDNLQSFSEKKSSIIALKKAEDELKKTKGGIIKEVKEAYLNYKKGLLQAIANFDKITYREEELKIAKARSGLNEIPFSELMQSYISLSDEKGFYIEALGSLFQAIAKLNKSTGYALFVDSENFMVADAKK